MPKKHSSKVARANALEDVKREFDNAWADQLSTMHAGCKAEGMTDSDTEAFLKNLKAKALETVVQSFNLEVDKERARRADLSTREEPSLRK